MLLQSAMKHSQAGMLGWRRMYILIYIDIFCVPCSSLDFVYVTINALVHCNQSRVYDAMYIYLSVFVCVWVIYLSCNLMLRYATAAGPPSDALLIAPLCCALNACILYFSEKPHTHRPQNCKTHQHFPLGNKTEHVAWLQYYCRELHAFPCILYVACSSCLDSGSSLRMNELSVSAIVTIIAAVCAANKTDRLKTDNETNGVDTVYLCARQDGTEKLHVHKYRKLFVYNVYLWNLWRTSTLFTIPNPHTLYATLNGCIVCVSKRLNGIVESHIRQLDSHIYIDFFAILRSDWERTNQRSYRRAYSRSANFEQMNKSPVLWSGVIGPSDGKSFSLRPVEYSKCNVAACTVATTI